MSRTLGSGRGRGGPLSSLPSFSTPSRSLPILRRAIPVNLRKQKRMAGKLKSDKWQDRQRWKGGSWISQTRARKKREAQHHDELHMKLRSLQKVRHEKKGFAGKTQRRGEEIFQNRLGPPTERFRKHRYECRRGKTLEEKMEDLSETEI